MAAREFYFSRARQPTHQWRRSEPRRRRLAEPAGLCAGLLAKVGGRESIFTGADEWKFLNHLPAIKVSSGRFGFGGVVVGFAELVFWRWLRSASERDGHGDEPHLHHATRRECGHEQGGILPAARAAALSLINFVVRADVFKHYPVLRQEIKNHPQIVGE